MGLYLGCNLFYFSAQEDETTPLYSLISTISEGKIYNNNNDNNNNKLRVRLIGTQLPFAACTGMV